MQPYPHTYRATATGRNEGLIAVESPPSPRLETAAPPEFGGPEGTWSPESLLCASVADCFVLTFRALSRAARVDWLRLACHVEGVLDKVEQVTQFTHFSTRAQLIVPEGSDIGRARTLLERAEQGCLVANSLRAARTLECQVIVARSADQAVPLGEATLQ